jgi:hypothetical protein
MKTAKQSIGAVFGRLKVVSLAYKDSHRCWHVNCVCECGQSKEVKFSALSSGGQLSCGCLRDEAARKQVAERCVTHGMSGTPTYETWASMISRCTNQNSNRYHTHGGRGIKVCSRWLSFENFFADMGTKPENLSLDRIDNNGDYEPSNCRWATSSEQAVNRRSTRMFDYGGESLCLKSLAQKVGIKRLTLTKRLKCGWPLSKALSTPVRQPNHSKGNTSDGTNKSI